MKTLRNKLEAAHASELAKVRKEMEERFDEREERVRREIGKIKDEETKRLVLAARKEVEAKMRAQVEALKAAIPSDKAKLAAEDQACQAVKMAVVRVEREQRDAIKQAVAEATKQLTSKHAVDLIAFREGENRRIEAARADVMKQLTNIHAREVAELKEKVETLDAELSVLREATSDVAAAREGETSAKEEAASAEDARAQMEAHVKMQVRHAHIPAAHPFSSLRRHRRQSHWPCWSRLSLRQMGWKRPPSSRC